MAIFFQDVWIYFLEWVGPVILLLIPPKSYQPSWNSGKYSLVESVPSFFTEIVSLDLPLCLSVFLFSFPSCITVLPFRSIFFLPRVHILGVPSVKHCCDRVSYFYLPENVIILLSFLKDRFSGLIVFNGQLLFSQNFENSIKLWLWYDSYHISFVNELGVNTKMIMNTEPTWLKFSVTPWFNYFTSPNRRQLLNLVFTIPLLKKKPRSCRTKIKQLWEYGDRTENRYYIHFHWKKE